MAKKVLYQALAFVPVVVTAAAVVPFSQTETTVLYPKTLLYQSLAEPVPIVSIPETITVDKWLRQFEVPVRSRIRPQDLVAFIPADVAQSGWQGSFSIPSRLRRPTPQDYGYSPTVTTTPEVVTVDKWFKSFENSWRRRFTLAGGEALVPVVAVAATPGVFAQSQDSLLVSRTLFYQSIADPIVVAATPEVVTADKWFVSFEQIIRVRWLSAAQQQAYADPAYPPIPPPPVPPMDGWSYDWSGPVRLHVLSTANQPDTVIPVIPQPDPPGPTGVYTVSGLYVIDQFTDNTVVYDYGGGVSHRTN
jgi:hypothetical protein